jgi:uncharacterized protein
MSRVLFLALVTSLLALPVRARNVEDVPNPRQTHAGWVTDEPHALGAAAMRIEERLEQLHQQSGAEVAWVVLGSIGDSDPHGFATELLHRWGVGRKDHDDGVLVLHVLDRRRVEIVTGYGVEAALPDIKCAWLLREVAVPAFRAGELARGHLQLSQGIERALRSPDVSHADLIAATQLADSERALAAQVAPAARVQPRRVARAAFTLPGKTGLRITAGVLMLLGIASYFWRVRIYVKRYRHHAHHNPPLPFALFGGLLVFGIGFGEPGMLPAIGVFAACSIWTLARGLRERGELTRWLAPRPCPRCSLPLQLLERDAASAALPEGPRREEKLGSVEYDVWRCSCGELSLDATVVPSQVLPCPGCKFHTFEHVQTVEKKPATESETGEADWFYACAVCGHQLQKRVEVPRISRASSSSSSWISSSSDSGSSSSSSSDSSSSDSFGGGDSGGGGAGESY